MFPVSGAEVFVASGAKNDLMSSWYHPIISHRTAYSKLDSPDTDGKNRFQRPSERARSLRVSTIGGIVDHRSAAICEAYTVSAGMHSLVTKSESVLRRDCTLGDIFRSEDIFMS
jgi:hypothetical protein